ncbi:MAG: hypothetical protein MI810_02160, partial [Flavobacteriales bacterium]|nr:hypothetical protein [Flavobacteriales bacterium]
MIDKLELVLDKEKEIDLSSKFIQLELEWFQDIISFRLENKDKPIRLLKAPHYYNSDIELGKYGDLVSELKLNDYERLLLILAVVPHIVPSLLSPLLNRLKGIRPVQFQEGGTFSKEGRAFIPTIETFLFLAAGQELEKRLDLLRIFNNKHALIDNHILSFGGTNTEVEEEAFFPNKIISITEEFYSNFILNQEYAPVFGRNFPAQRISTKMEWEDLVLRSSTKMQVEELRNWLKYKDILQEKYNI